MDATHPRKGDDAASRRRFDSAHLRRIAVERHMWSIFVAMAHAWAGHAEQMTFSKHNHAIEQIAAKRADPFLGISVLPRRARCDLELLDPQAVDARIECITGDAVAVSDQRP
jgi:hypothetical protein